MYSNTHALNKTQHCKVQEIRLAAEVVRQAATPQTTTSVVIGSPT